MKNKYTLAFLFLIILFLSCEKDKNEKEQSLVIKTDKEIYSNGEFISVEISNNLDSAISYFVCSSYTGSSPIVWKYENNEWTGYWSPICDGFMSYCCGELGANDSYYDNISIEFEIGRYRIGYSFILDHKLGYQNFYSNEFMVK